MKVTLTFNPESEAGLLAKAQARGMDLQLGSGPSTETAQRDEAVRRMLEFGDKYHLTLGQPITREIFREACRNPTFIPCQGHKR